MSDTRTSSEAGKDGRIIRAPQNLAGGLVLVGVATLAFFALGDLNAGTLDAMGSALMPRALAVFLGLLGLALVASGFLRDGFAMDGMELRGPILVLISIVFFAITIRPFSFGAISTPGLGLVIAAPVAIVISGFATREARLRELLVLALGLTPLCMLLFGNLLNLPIPMFPDALIDSLPAGWSQKAVLRIVSAAMLVLAGLLFMTGRAAIDASDPVEK